MKKYIKTIITGLLFISTLGAPVLGDGPQKGDFSLIWSEDFAWMRTNDAPVNAVLTAIGRAAKIPIQLDEDNEETVTLDLFFEITGHEDIEKMILAVWPSAIITYQAGPEDDTYIITQVRTMSRADNETVRRTREANLRASARAQRTPQQAQRSPQQAGSTPDREAVRQLLGELREAREAGNNERAEELRNQIREMSQRIRAAEREQQTDQRRR